jgi:hypothetical protein
MKVELKGLEVLGVLSGLSERRMASALATAMTRTAVEVRDAELVELQRAIDRPTPYTLRSLYVRGATAQRQYAEVWFKDTTTGSGIAATNYLGPQVDGGSRKHKRLEASLRAAGHLPAGWLVVPGAGCRIDAYGNADRGQVMQVLSQLRVQLVSGFDRSMSRDARKQINAQRKAGGRFFVIPPGGKAQGGVYQRELMGRTVTPVFIFVRSATYRARFDFDGVAQRTIDRVVDGHITRAVMEQVERSMRPGTQGVLW